MNPIRALVYLNFPWEDMNAVKSFDYSDNGTCQ